MRVELQADCFASVWAHHSQRGKNWLGQDDLEEAMNAAAQIGDDTLQRRRQNHVVPDSFTHGTSAQRQRWFQSGDASGSRRSATPSPHSSSSAALAMTGAASEIRRAVLSATPFGGRHDQNSFTLSCNATAPSTCHTDGM